MPHILLWMIRGGSSYTVFTFKNELGYHFYKAPFCFYGRVYSECPDSICPKSVYRLPNRNKIRPDTSYSLCICLSLVGSKSQTEYNPKELRLRCGKVSGSASVKCIIMANMYECDLA